MNCLRFTNFQLRAALVARLLFAVVTIGLVLPASADSARGQAACGVTEAMLTGAWEQRSGHGFLQQFALGINGQQRTFNSWLHSRPEILGGSWALENCELILTPSFGALKPFRFKNPKIKRGQLWLIDAFDGSKAVYRKLPTD